MLGPQGLDGSLTPPLPQPVTAKKYRVTKSISLAGPTEADFQRNAELEKFLIDSGLYECNEDAAKREAVLGRIGEVVKCWVKQLTRQRGCIDTYQMVEDANVVIFTFGSYRLGVLGPGADMDTLCVGPSYVNRKEDFFIILHDMLTEMEEVSELQLVPHARVPIMKFKFPGISIDLLYASISQFVVPKVLQTSDFCNCKPAYEIRKRMKLVMDLYKQMQVEGNPMGNYENRLARQILSGENCSIKNTWIDFAKVPRTSD